MSLGEQTDFLAMGIREMLDDKFIGSRSSEMKAVLLKTAISTYFLELKNRGDLISYSDDDIHVNISGNTAYINASAVVPAQEIKNIEVSLTYMPGNVSV